MDGLGVCVCVSSALKFETKLVFCFSGTHTHARTHTHTRTFLLLPPLLFIWAAFSVRFSALLRSGSLVFKSTRYREWYSERLRAWKDYIPVNHDTSGLADKLQWASTQEPEFIEHIIQNGRATVERHIRPEDMQCYTYRMMLEYMQLFDPASFHS